MNSQVFAIGRRKIQISVNFAPRVLDLDDWENPYGLPFGALVYEPEVDQRLGEVAEWKKLPGWIKGPARTGLTKKEHEALVKIGVATNANPVAYYQVTGEEPMRVWGSYVAFLAGRLLKSRKKSIVLVMHRAATYASWIVGSSFEIVINPKRLHHKNNQSKIGAALTTNSIAYLKKVDLKDKSLRIFDPFVATGASIEALLIVLDQMKNLPKKVEVESIFCTQQGALSLYNLLQNLHISLEIFTVKLMRRMTKQGYVVYSRGDLVGKQIVTERRKRFGEVSEVFENQAGGDAGDNLERYLELTWGKKKLQRRIRRLKL